MKYEKKTIVTKSKDLGAIYHKHKVLLSICLKSKERAISDKNEKYISSLGIYIERKKKKNREKYINEYFDNLQKELTDNAILCLVATFEKLIFNKIPFVIETAKETLADNYDNGNPFSKTIKSFVKDTNNINKISDIQNLLIGNISMRLSNKLKEIIDYRHRIAHGRRFGQDTLLTVDEVLESLNEVINLVD